MADATDALKTLHSRVIDSLDGYKEARTHIEGSETGAFVDRCIEEREGFHETIHRQLEAQGITVDESGSAAAKAHRGIFKIRDVLSSGNSGIYSECARGDEYLASSYDDAIAAVDGDPKWDFLVDQRAKVQAAVKEAKSLA